MTKQRDANDILREGGTDDLRRHIDEAGPPQDDEPLRYVDLALDLKPRPWLIAERIPRRNVTLLSGEGAIGKSTLLMQLLGATVLAGGQWLGTFPEHGPALYLTAEEEDNEARLRLEAVADSLGTSRQRLKDSGLHVLSFAGRDAILGEPDRNGIIRPTPLFARIRDDVLRLKPKLIGIDAAADVFGGNEINRAQTRQFITILRGLGIDTDSAVMLVAHPSLEGIRSDTGLSGTTAWHNSVRARMYFKKAPGDDKTLRVLEVKKNNYGPEQENVLLRWRDGVYMMVPGEGSIERLTEDARIDELFLTLLRRFTEQGRNVSGKDNGPNRAPKLFAADPQAKGSSKKQFEEAMARLFAANKIRVVVEGRPSHQTSRLAETTHSAAQSAEVILFKPRPTPQPTPSQLQPTPGQGEGVGSPPITPQESAGAGRPLEGSGPADSQEREEGPSASAVDPAPAPSASVPFMITAKMKRDLRERGLSDQEVSELTPQQAHVILSRPAPQEGQNLLLRRRNLAGVLAAWSATIGIGQPQTVEQVITAADGAVADDDEAGCNLKLALTTVAPQENEPNDVDAVRLEDWLRSVSGVEVDQLMLLGGGIDEKGAPQWTLELRVEPDRGSVSN